MTCFLSIFFAVLFSSSLCGQPLCGLEKLSKEDKALLQNFCTDFKDAINTKSKVKLADLIRFPFTCSHCVIDSAKGYPDTYLKITKKIFFSSQYQIFFVSGLREVVNEQNIFEILNLDTENKKSCSYFFGYPIIKPSENSEGFQGFLSITKTNGRYKITAAWTVP